MTTLPEAVAKTREPRQSLAIIPAQQFGQAGTDFKAIIDSLRTEMDLYKEEETRLKSELMIVQADKQITQDALNEATAVKEIIINAASSLQSVAQGKKTTKPRGKAKS